MYSIKVISSYKNVISEFFSGHVISNAMNDVAPPP